MRLQPKVLLQLGAHDLLHAAAHNGRHGQEQSQRLDGHITHGPGESEGSGAVQMGGGMQAICMWQFGAWGEGHG